MLLLLDTHVWVWAVTGDTRRLGRRARQRIASAERKDAIRVSSATVFEIAALHAAGRLRLARTLEAWVAEALGMPGVRLALVTADVALDAGAIRRDALGDPLDRLLAATARQLDATLVTADARILDFATSTRSVRTLDAGR